MLSNWLANFALRRSREALDQYYLAPTDAAAEIHLRHAEDWDDARCWIDGLGTWRELRRKTEQNRTVAMRKHLPFVGMPSIEELRP